MLQTALPVATVAIWAVGAKATPAPCLSVCESYGLSWRLQQALLCWLILAVSWTHLWRVFSIRLCGVGKSFPKCGWLHPMSAKQKVVWGKTLSFASLPGHLTSKFIYSAVVVAAAAAIFLYWDQNSDSWSFHCGLGTSDSPGILYSPMTGWDCWHINLWIRQLPGSQPF